MRESAAHAKLRCITRSVISNKTLAIHREIVVVIVVSNASLQ
jgi:hypothetical protein